MTILELEIHTFYNVNNLNRKSLNNMWMQICSQL